MKFYEGFVDSLKNDDIYVKKNRHYLINEKQNNESDIVPWFPLNKRMKFDMNIMIKAIQHGMMVLILYKGEKDKWRGGRERIICPLNMGINKNTQNLLIRGFHISGFSVSKKNEVKKVWRLFKASNIKSMEFVGDFLRMPPKSYKMNDRVMTEKTIARADFNVIRKNQEMLIAAGKIESQEEIEIGKKDSSSVTKITVKNTDTIVDFRNPWKNEYFNKKEKLDIKITILKTIFSNEYIAVLGALGEQNKTVKVIEDKKEIGSYKVVTSFTGKDLNKNRIIKGKSEFKLYLFEKKI